MMPSKYEVRWMFKSRPTVCFVKYKCCHKKLSNFDKGMHPLLIVSSEKSATKKEQSPSYTLIMNSYLITQ